LVVTTSLVLDRANQALVAGTYGRSVFSATIDPARVFQDGFESGDTSRWSAYVPGDGSGVHRDGILAE
jgi:hypothetical protein